MTKEKGLKWDTLQGYKGKCRPFLAQFFTISEAFSKGMDKVQGGFKDDVVLEGNSFLEGSKTFQPPVCFVKKFIGANSTYEIVPQMNRLQEFSPKSLEEKSLKISERCLESPTSPHIKGGMFTLNLKGLGEIVYYCKLVNKEGQETLGSESQYSHLHV